MNTTSHRPEFVAEMKTKLEEEQETLMRELGSLGKPHGGEYESDFPDYGRNDEENATEVADFQASASTTDALEERLKNVQAALTRIEDGTYGVTVDGDVIPEERLRANPAASTIIVK